MTHSIPVSNQNQQWNVMINSITSFIPLPGHICGVIPSNQKNPKFLLKQKQKVKSSCILVKTKTKTSIYSDFVNI